MARHQMPVKDVYQKAHETYAIFGGFNFCYAFLCHVIVILILSIMSMSERLLPIYKSCNHLIWYIIHFDSTKWNLFALANWMNWFDLICV